MGDFDERELVARCQRGDDSAFAELVDRYKNLVYALIYRMMNDRTQVDDLAQDVFLKVHRGLPYLRGEARSVYGVTGSSPTLRFGAQRDAAHASAGDVAEPVAADATSRYGLRRREGVWRAARQYRFLVSAHYLEGVSTRRSNER